MGGVGLVITRFNAKSAQLDWTCQLELELDNKAFIEMKSQSASLKKDSTAGG